eukprot:CAMPEP_0119313732 /NCGR_PEP_ID=MMETSP1333-20130426/30210_1 /TAXON_ID=418940 /ORGANISM="Scyphosphaera apsteinii, Strain RCC1455" /LENGTH=418 /DNA_ID=CAMNT_0007318651 /DNA_START=244 /DNA_END=1500 /DNA_ORIENTATION=-
MQLMDGQAHAGGRHSATQTISAGVSNGRLRSLIRVPDALQQLHLNAPAILEREIEVCILVLEGNGTALMQLFKECGVPTVGKRMQLNMLLQQRELIEQLAKEELVTLRITPITGDALKCDAAECSRLQPPLEVKQPAPVVTKPEPSSSVSEKSSGTPVIQPQHRTFADINGKAYQRTPAASVGAPADISFGESIGRIYVHEQLTMNQGQLEQTGTRPSPDTCCWPSAQTADALANELRVRALGVVSIGAGEGFVEALLEARGIHVIAVDVDVLSSPSDYQNLKQFCSEVRRVPPECLFHIEQPLQTALLFVWGQSLPWRAYLARYPSIALVAIIGDPHPNGATEPSALALDGLSCWKLLWKMAVPATIPNAELVVYEHIAASCATAGADAEVVRAITPRPRFAPSYRIRWDFLNMPFC